MKGFAWGGVAFFFLITGALFLPRMSGTVEAFVRAWWVLPLFASLASLLALEGSLVIRCSGRANPSTVPTAAYLISGPSVAAFNLSAYIPQSVPPPTWVGGVMLALLLGSAWAYYLSSVEPGDESGVPEGSPSKISPPCAV
jgi:hypothetical protein